MGNSFDLPPLPEPEDGPMMNRHPYFTADQMRAYARAAVEAEREACERIVMENAEQCRKGSELWFILASNAKAIRERGKS